MATTVFKGSLSLGLLSIPIKVTVAARKETGIGFNLLHKECHGRIKQATHCPTCDKYIDRSETVKGYEYEKDRYIIVPADALEAAEAEASKVMEITSMVSADEVDPILFEESFYLEPDLGGNKGYKLLLTALEAEQKYAIATIIKNGREHIAIIRPHRGVLMFHTMFYREELRQLPDVKIDRVELKADEVTLARQLIAMNTAEFDHDAYQDRYRAVVEELIESLKKGEAPKTTSVPAPKKETVDIMAALTASIARAKPAAKPAKATVPQPQPIAPAKGPRPRKGKVA